MDARKMKNQSLRVKAVLGTAPKSGKKTGSYKTKAVKGVC